MSNQVTTKVSFKKMELTRIRPEVLGEPKHQKSATEPPKE